MSIVSVALLFVAICFGAPGIVETLVEIERAIARVKFAADVTAKTEIRMLLAEMLAENVGRQLRLTAEVADVALLRVRAHVQSELWFGWEEPRAVSALVLSAWFGFRGTAAVAGTGCDSGGRDDDVSGKYGAGVRDADTCWWQTR